MRQTNSLLSMPTQVGIILLFTFLHLIETAGNEWSYDEQERWSNQYHECGGMSQSPINIDKWTTSINSSMHLEFHGYQNLNFGFNVVNNGHSVQFNYVGDEKSAPLLSGSALNNENYSLAQFHFHWGQERGLGSEHTVNDRSFSLELHFVHYNRNRYYTLKDAIESKQGVVVLAVFYMIERERNPKLEEVTRLVHQVQTRNPNYTANPDVPLVLDGLLPDAYHRRHFYRYSGSLTTPPCTEGITWLVLHDPNHIGLEQIEQFRQVRHYQQGNLIAPNYRHTQNLRGRIVEASWNSHRNFSPKICTSSAAIAISVISILCRQSISSV